MLRGADIGARSAADRRGRSATGSKRGAAVAIDRELGYSPARYMGVDSTATTGVAIVYGVIRTYAGPGAKELMDLIVERKDEVEGLLRGVTGFVGYTLIQTDDGGATITVCQDKAGAEESIQVARDWVAANAADLGAPAPTITEGSVGMHLS